jgi:outer membrane protein W
MRLTRSLVSGLASLALLPAAAAAQQGHLFDNSWFWGVNGGVSTFWTQYVAHTQAPTVGIEWLLTRTHTGLYVAYNQSFLKGGVSGEYQNAGKNYTDSTYTTYNTLSYNDSTPIHSVRQLDLALMGFPTSGKIRPYAGVGISVVWVQTQQNVVYPTGYSSVFPLTYWDPTAYGTSFRDQASDWVGALFIVGVQAQLSRFSIYGQAKATTVGTGHLLTNGAYYTVQAGVRVNVASWGDAW